MEELLAWIRRAKRVRESAVLEAFADRFAPPRTRSLLLCLASAGWLEIMSKGRVKEIFVARETSLDPRLLWLSPSESHRSSRGPRSR